MGRRRREKMTEKVRGQRTKGAGAPSWKAPLGKSNENGRAQPGGSAEKVLKLRCLNVVIPRELRRGAPFVACVSIGQWAAVGDSAECGRAVGAPGAEGRSDRAGSPCVVDETPWWCVLERVLALATVELAGWPYVVNVPMTARACRPYNAQRLWRPPGQAAIWRSVVSQQTKKTQAPAVVRGGDSSRRSFLPACW